jgi:2-keto-4-pentenoate hydratase/2-oxohepta-3-ene-1,7-dioic acid hydratase in catechol pathway
MKIPFRDKEVEIFPTKIVALVKNYKAHAQEMGGEVPAEPSFFLKPPSSLLPLGGTVILPATSQRVDYEVELAVVMGKRARKVSREEALDFVLGYSLLLDVTARDLQARAMKEKLPWTISKGFDTFAPFGPCLVPKEEIDPLNCEIWLKVNGELKQRGNTSDLVFSVPELISYISGIMTLEPMDIIATGTPSGVGPLKDGDVVEAGSPSIGVLKVKVKREG